MALWPPSWLRLWLAAQVRIRYEEENFVQLISVTNRSFGGIIQGLNLKFKRQNLK